MQLDRDKIIFESKREIEQIMTVLSTYNKEHPNNSEYETADRLCDLLDGMHMCW